MGGTDRRHGTVENAIIAAHREAQKIEQMLPGHFTRGIVDDINAFDRVPHGADEIGSDPGARIKCEGAQPLRRPNARLYTGGGHLQHPKFVALAVREFIWHVALFDQKATWRTARMA